MLVPWNSTFHTRDSYMLRKERWRMGLWLIIVLLYVGGQAYLYGQGVSPQSSAASDTPWEHLTLEGALALAVGVQYRENRAKEAVARQLAVEAAAAITKATSLMVDVTAALERLCSKIDGLAPRHT